MKETTPVRKDKRYAPLLQSLLSTDPEIRRNQVILDSSEFVDLSNELRDWLARQVSSWHQLDSALQDAQVRSDASLSQEAKDLYTEWAYQAKRRCLVDSQRRSDKEIFEKKIKSIKRQSIKDLGDLGISRQDAETIFMNHLMIEIASELELSLSDVASSGNSREDLMVSLKRDFYPFDGTKVPFIDVGWSSTGRIYGPSRLPLESVFRKSPSPLNELPTTLYLISVDLPKLGLGASKQWKIGITKKQNILGVASNSRYSGRVHGAIAIVDSIRFSDWRDAFFLEQKIINISENKRLHKASDFRVNVNPMFESVIRELTAQNGYGYHEAARQLRDMAKGLGLGPTEWVWKGRSEDYVKKQFRILISYAPYFGKVVNTYTQAELLL